MIFALGINHHSAPLAIRERVAFHASDLEISLRELAAAHLVREAAILSTCNRSELYCAGGNPAQVLDWLAARHRITQRELTPYLQILEQPAAIRHAFRVASGLDSMVIGEPQILGQMKQAVRAAESAGTLGASLHKLFQQAFAAAKEVRSSTAIGANVVSMAAAAVQLAERIFESVAGHRVLFIGAGEMVDLCATHFAARQPRQMTVANRTVERAQVLAERIAGQAIRLDELAEVLPQHDIVISCTASPLPIIGLGMVERALKVRRHRPLFIVDLAVPRDVEAEVGELSDIFLYTVDDLAQVVDSGMESRQTACAEAEAIIAQRQAQFLHWLAGRETVPIIRALRDSSERMRRHELEHALKQLAKGEAPAQVLEQLSQRLTGKFLHAPLQALNKADNAEREQIRSVAARLFHLPAGD